MNFINDRELALRFKNNAVHSNERFLYFIIYMTISTLFSGYILGSTLYADPINKFDVLSDIINVIIIIAGTTICYRTNRAGDDREFIERMMCIGFPAAIRSFIILFIFIILYLIFIGSIERERTSEEYSLYAIPPVIAYGLYFYWRMNASIRIAAN
ncbi:hypothetical protein C5748_03330 [Phyllobacterium phragmitis]|uniref:Uncharacterized protein n=1 Tax=Phyllobacterium phragmitis TaxID=2670329 RepID=A0A2S9IXJ7_9HYPH|nr:hypothetical protein C5748_03330 [Phyllobacterium phragmitis]